MLQWVEELCIKSRLYSEAMKLCREKPDARSVCYFYIGEVYYNLGEFEKSRIFLTECLHLRRRLYSDLDSEVTSVIDMLNLIKAIQT